MTKVDSPPGPRLGIDENGLGPRLGPLIVTAVWADLNKKGAAQLGMKLPPSLGADLNDSKRILSSGNVSLGEAWARGIAKRQFGVAPSTPAELLARLCIEDESSLRKDCPKKSEPQCWHLGGEGFEASEDELERVEAHLDALETLGIHVRAVQTEVVCTGRLNLLKEQGIHRFMADLHAMERLTLHFRKSTEAPLVATCGKVGGIGKYAPFFGPLSGHLHTALEEGRASSRYHFPKLGELRFVRDADAHDPLVMLASMVGKYLRELLMGRITSFYSELLNEPGLHPSGYHDPVTTKFVTKTNSLRKRLKIASDCFERRPATERSRKKRKNPPS